MLNRRSIIIIVGIFTTLIVAFGVYYYFAKQKAAPGATIVETLFPTAGEGVSGGIPGLFRPLTGGVKEQPKLVRLSDEPVAGFIALARGRVRYVERSTGHVYEVSGDGTDKIRVSNTTIPRVFRTTWSPKGDYVALGILDDNQNAEYFLATLTGTTTEGVFLPINSVPQAFSSTNQLAYFAQVANNYSLITADTKNQKPKAVYTSPFRDFIAAWPTDTVFGLATKPSGTVKGYLYKIDTKLGTFERVIGDLFGLEALWSPDAKKILISEFNAQTGEANASAISDRGTKIKELGNTLAAKCAWSRTDPQAIYCALPKNYPSAVYPDDWYQGKISFQDDIQKLYLTATSSEPVLGGQNFDIAKMDLDARDEFLYFLDKNDEALWGLRLSPQIVPTVGTTTPR